MPEGSSSPESAAASVSIEPTAEKSDEKAAEDKKEPTEAEKEKSRHEYIEGMVGSLANGEWQKTRESERLKERYGAGLLGRFRAWLSGESDFTYDKETGEMRHNVANEVGRRAMSVAWKSAKTIAIISGIGLLTGGVGVIPCSAIIGSAFGRGVAEAIKGFSGKEGKLRQELILARADYYKDAENLARQIGPENPGNLPPERLEEYKKDRNEKVAALVNLVFAEENKVVEKAEAETEKQKGLGQVIAAEKELGSFLKKWRTYEEVLAFVGGAASVGAASLLDAKEHIATQMHDRIMSGDSVKMDIDKDGIWHNVSKIDQGIKEANNISTDYVFHYRNLLEQRLADENFATVLNQGQYGSHTISNSIGEGITGAAQAQVWRQSMWSLLGLAGSWGMERGRNAALDSREAARSKFWSDARKKSIESLSEPKPKEEVVEPEAGEIWEKKTKKGKPEKVKIISIDGTDPKLKTVEFTAIDSKDKKPQKMALSSFLVEAKKLEGVEKKQGIFQPEHPEERKDYVRQAAKYTVDQLDRFEELDDEDPKKRDDKFRALTRALWKEFAVHGRYEIDKKGNKCIFVNKTDLDGRTCVGLFEKAGFDVKNLKYIDQSDIETGRVVLDTGDMHGTIYDNAKRALVIDHHAKDSDPTVSAAGIVYETLVKMDLIDQNETYQKVIDFINEYDNSRYQLDLESYKKSYNNLYGLARYMSFSGLFDFFKDGRKPEDEIAVADLAKYGLSEEDIDRQMSIVKNSDTHIKKAESEGFTFECEKYGKVLVDLHKKIPGAYDSVRAYGYDTYIMWTPKTQSFFISSSKGIQDDFEGGKIVRQNMSIKPMHNREALKTTLGRVLTQMAGEGFVPAGKLAEFLRSEKIAKDDEVVAGEALPAAA
ncbi:MAG: hypothetical protein WC451_02870 [Patescibacteria group bacterium]